MTQWGRGARERGSCKATNNQQSRGNHHHSQSMFFSSGSGSAALAVLPPLVLARATTTGLAEAAALVVAFSMVLFIASIFEGCVLLSNNVQEAKGCVRKYQGWREQVGCRERLGPPFMLKTADPSHLRKCVVAGGLAWKVVLPPIKIHPQPGVAKGN